MESDILYVQPSFLRGFSRTFDLWGNLDEYNNSLTPAEADRLALATDLYMIGVDFRSALKETVVELENENEEKSD